MRWVIAALLPVVAVPLIASADEGVPVAVIEGFGWGHGVGMAQDGALWMGREGTDAPGILRHFYPGTRLGKASGELRVSVAKSPSREVILAFPAGGELREDSPDAPSPGFPVRLGPGGQVSVRFDGQRYWVAPYGGKGPGPGLIVESSGNGPGLDIPDPGEAKEALDLSEARRLAPPEATLPSPSGAAWPATTTSTLPFPPTPGPAPALPTTTTTIPGPFASPSTTAPPAPPPTAPPATGAPSPPASPPPSTGVPPPRTPPTTRRARRPPPPPPAPVGVPTGRALRAVPPDDNTVFIPALARRYRGTIEVVGVGTRPAHLALFNRIDVETYLRGMGEVLDPSWPKASLQAQAVAARTYALRTMAARGEICSGQRCQVYLGQQAEYRAMDEAVSQTAGQVLMYRSGLASAVYSANAAGVSASRTEGFGPLPEGSDAEFPYLRSAPYPTRDRFPWSVTVALADVARRLGYSGKITSLVIGRTGPSGRALEVVVDGASGPKTVPGLEIAGALGLRSTLFSVRVELAESAPPPPPSEALQAPPGEAPPSGLSSNGSEGPKAALSLTAIIGRWSGFEATRGGREWRAASFPFWSCLAPGLPLLVRVRRSRPGANASGLQA